MSRSRRQIESSEVALMAVVTKAMGAFLILMIFGFKYYVEDANGKREAENATQEVQNAQNALEDAQKFLAEQIQKQGDVSQEDYDKVLQDLQTAIENLQKAIASIAELKARLDQTLSQNNRLREELALARAELETTQEKLAESEKRLRISDALVTELKRQLNDAEQNLQQALAQAKKLSKDLEATRLDLAATKEKLEASEIERKSLAATLERARKPPLALELEVYQSGLASFQLAYARQLIPTEASKSLSEIPYSPASNDSQGYDYSPMTRSFLCDGPTDITVNGSNHSYTQAGGKCVNRLYLTELRDYERLAIYIKALDALPEGNRIYEGLLTINLSNALREVKLQLPESNPFVFICLLDITPESCTVVIEPGAEHLAWFQKRIAEAPIFGSCLACDPFAPENRKDLIRHASERIRSEFLKASSSLVEGAQTLSDTETERLEKLATTMAESIADQKTSLKDLARLVELLKFDDNSRLRVGASRTEMSDLVETSLRSQMQAAKLPAPIIDEFFLRLKAGRWSLADGINRLDRQLGEHPSVRARQKLREKQLPEPIVVELSAMVGLGKMTEETALSFIDSFRRNAPTGKPVTAGEQLSKLLDLLKKAGFSEAFVFLIKGNAELGSFDVDQAYRTLESKLQVDATTSKEP